MHRVVLELERAFGSKPMTRDIEVGIVWRLLGERPPEFHQGIKPYTFHFEDAGNECYRLSFSSVLPSLTDEVTLAARNLLSSQTALECCGISFRIRKITPIQDLTFYSNAVRMISLSGCRVICKKDVHGKFVERTIHAERNPQSFIQAMTRMLAAKTKLFLGKEVSEDEIQIQYLKLLDSEQIDFHHSKQCGQYVTFRISAPKEVLETAAYSGIGRKTGCGFGAVAVI